MGTGVMMKTVTRSARAPRTKEKARPARSLTAIRAVRRRCQGVLSHPPHQAEKPLVKRRPVFSSQIGRKYQVVPLAQARAFIR